MAETLAAFTTLQVGGPAAQLISPTSSDDLVDALRDAWDSGDEWLILGGGSNLLIADEGFDGVVIRVCTRGIERLADDAAGDIRLRVQAGEPWYTLVAHTVDNGWAGIEALSGIPGLSGAAPIQNIGAYGQELASALVGVHFLDRITGELIWLDAAELELGYRTSALKQGREGLIVSLEIRLTPAAAAPVHFAQLASALGVEFGATVSLAEVRSAVRALRGSKGMLLDSADPDSVSAGSFFTNPIVSAEFASGLPGGTPRWPADAAISGEAAAAVKLSAAWLIEHSGISRGFRLPHSRAAVSRKHTLALVNTGGATAAEIAELARYIQTRVLGTFGVILQPEPTLVGVFVG